MTFLPGTSPVTPGALGPTLPVTPPERSPAPHGLLSTAIEIPEPLVERNGVETEPWTLGFQYQPEQCGIGGIWVPCVDRKRNDLNPGGSGSGSGEQLKSLRDAPEIETFIPFTVEGQFTCGTMGFQVARYRERAERNMTLSQEPLIEREFWTGAQMAEHPTGQGNFSLVRSTTTDGVLNPGWDGSNPASIVPVSASQGLRLVQQGIASCADGSRGMIHAPVYIAEQWTEDHALIEDGQRLSTMVRRSWIVAGAGYPGTGPLVVGGGVPHVPTNPNHLWVYGTLMVNWRAGRVRLVPGEDEMEETIAQAMRPRSAPGESHGSDNRVTYRAERSASAVADPCCVVAVLIDVCATGCS